MKSEDLKNKGQTLAPYASPSVKVIETSMQRVICASDNEGYNDGDTSGWYNF